MPRSIRDFSNLSEICLRNLITMITEIGSCRFWDMNIRVFIIGLSSNRFQSNIKSIPVTMRTRSSRYADITACTYVIMVSDRRNYRLTAYMPVESRTSIYSAVPCTSNSTRKSLSNTLYSYNFPFFISLFSMCVRVCTCVRVCVPPYFSMFLYPDSHSRE